MLRTIAGPETVTDQLILAELDPTTANVPVPVPPGAAPAPGPGGKVHSGPGKQGTRMIKPTAACCGYTVRTTRRWLDEGYPLCPHGQPMHES
jgi:hypothetical protein